ncbi:MAG TPA: DNA primase [Firmicutes bacterium]|nr:DNA primase [Bacillota bacterium]
MAFVSNDEINEIRAQADIVSIIGSYIPLTQRGKNYVCVCPFHDDHSPSMSVSSEKQIYKCFSCGATGNVFTFVSEYENVPFIEAVSIVANKIGRKLSLDTYKSNVNQVFKEEYEIMLLAQKFYQNNLRTSFAKEANKYLKDRNMTEDIIKEFGIGLSLDSNDSLIKLLNSKNYDNKKLENIGLINNVNGKFYDMFSRRITFPLWDKDGNIVGFSARVYRGEKDVSKYMNSKESKIFKKGETLYNYHNAVNHAKREKSIIVVEGFMDAIRISSIGIKNVVALQGTAMTDNQITMLKKLRVKVILCLDNDNAGLIATLNNGEELVKNNIETFVIRLSGEKDPDEYILANGAEAFQKNVQNPISFFEFKINNLKSNKDLNNVEDLATYVNDVLKNLSTTTDEILREVTLNKLSNDYNLSIDVLKKKLLSFAPVEVKSIKQPAKKERVKKEAYTIASEKILYFMMNGNEYINEYRNKLGFFSDSIHREIANEIVYYYETNKKITVADFITYITNKNNIKEKVMEIVNNAINDIVTIEAMDEYIDVVLKITTKNEIKRLKDLMKKELDMDKKMKLAEQIAELKKEDV